MNIPQEELDKLNQEPFDGHEEVEEEPEETVEPVEEEVSEPSDKDSVADKARIPYSRFETVNEAKIRAEERIKFLEEQLNSKKEEKTEDVDVPNEWIELYGDNETAREAYKIQLRQLDKIREDATLKAIEEIEKRQTQRKSEQEQNLAYIEEGLKRIETSLGRKLTEVEENTILDIQDEFTPKDEEGNYLAPLLSAEKAFEVYNLRQANSQAKKTIARRKVVSITGASSESESSDPTFENYRPGVGGLWRDKLK